MAGEVISVRTARQRARRLDRIAIVEISSKQAIDASALGNEFKYINHSCSPNAYMRIRGDHVEFYALRRIGNGEEITCNYGESHHNGTLKCRCNSDACKGYI